MARWGPCVDVYIWCTLIIAALNVVIERLGAMAMQGHLLHLRLVVAAELVDDGHQGLQCRAPPIKPAEVRSKSDLAGDMELSHHG